MTVTPSSPAGAQAYVASVSATKLGNWAIAKQAQMWGTTSSLGGKIRSGDELFIWEAPSGWLARCIVTSDAYEVTPTTAVPWLDGAAYRWLFEIAVVTETAPIKPAVADHKQVSTGIPTVYLSRFSRLGTDQADALRALFPATPAALQTRAPVGVVEPPSGWGRGRDRERNKLIEQAGINTATKHYEALGYTLSADRQKDGVGYDLEFTNQHETLKVEVKGIAAAGLAFNLTAKELDVAGSDPAFRLCAVTQALGNPVVEVLLGSDVATLTIKATQYRAVRS